MNNPATLAQLDGRLLAILIVLTLIDLILRGVSMWLAAGHRQKGWFIALLLLNTFGILPALYLIYFQPPSEADELAEG